jgi:malonate transporter and related proteins
MIGLIAETLVPVFFVLALGYYAGWGKHVNNEQLTELNAFVMQFAVPASLLAAMATTPAVKLKDETSLILIYLVVMLASYGLWYVWARVVAKADSRDAAIQALTFSFPNMAAVALPVLAGLQGQRGVVDVAVVLAVGSVVPTSITVFTLSLTGPGRSEGSHGGRIAGALRTALLKPVVVAPILGAALSLTGVGLAPVAVASLKLIGQASMGGALFLTGLVLSAQPFKADVNVAASTLAMDVLRPLAVFGLTRLLPLPPDVAVAAVIIAAVPAGFFGILFGSAAGAPVRTSASMILASTVLAALSLTVVIALTFNGRAP